MVWLLLTFLCYVLSYITVPVHGQCTVPSCSVSLSGSEESLQVNLEEHDRRLETMNQNMSSAFEKLETAVNRINVRGQEELCQDLKTMYYNMSVKLDRASEKKSERLECNITDEQEIYLSSMNSSLSAMIVRNDAHIQAIDRRLDEKFQVMQDQLSSLINDSVLAALRELNQKFLTLNEALSSAIDKSNDKLNATLNRVKESNQSVESQDHCRNTSIVCDCSDIKANGYTTSGVYPIYVVDQGQQYYANAFCDMTTTNGAWTVFQRRKDGSVDFYRGWSEYANGFGNPDGEYWLGNNFLHLLMSQRRYRLRIELEDFEGGKRYAEYSTFNISSSADKYRLRIGTYSGNVHDSLNYHNGQRFTTKDNDNDVWTSGNNAVRFRGAWWYEGSYHSNLNGVYLRGPYTSTNCSSTCYEGITWYGFRDYSYSLKATEMKISPF